MCMLFILICVSDCCNFASSFQSPDYFQLQKHLVNNDSSQTSSEQEEIDTDTYQKASNMFRKTRNQAITAVHVTAPGSYMHNGTVNRTLLPSSSLSTKSWCTCGHVSARRTKQIKKVMRLKHLQSSGIKRHFHHFF